jgi:hypothetical protein
MTYSGNENAKQDANANNPYRFSVISSVADHPHLELHTLFFWLSCLVAFVGVSIFNTVPLLIYCDCQNIIAYAFVDCRFIQG